ncbi:unnamed protein product [Microthlaspi erraticum]|uniref:Uncharacterized protein n=1 Tax=Microthlaspi erraticum TaxID=1685480 RepID=A0A6D2KIG7_9BRAS|nr:unnamed protein product [Microthlaspi erraticum]
MRIEGEKGVKTQSAPKHWPRTRKVILAEQFQSGRPLRSSREGTSRARPDYSSRDRNVRAAHTNRERTGRDRPIFVSERTDRAVDPGNKRSASAEISRPFEIWPTKSLDRDKIHRPSAKIFSAKVSPLFI